MDMNSLQPADEIFCLEFENRALKSLLFSDEAERWVHGLISKQVEDEHIARYKLACDYSKGKEIIEVAGGSGYGSWMLADEGKASSVWSGDIDPDSVRYASLRYPHQNITREVMDVRNLNFSSKFDVAVSFETIEHLDDPDGFITKVHSALRDNGILLISTPVAQQTTTRPHNRFHTIEWTFRDFHAKLSARFNIEKVFIQSLELGRSPLSHIIHRLLNKPRSVPDPTPIEWKGDMPPDLWRGYQVVVCRKK